MLRGVVHGHAKPERDIVIAWEHSPALRCEAEEVHPAFEEVGRKPLHFGIVKRFIVKSEPSHVANSMLLASRA